MTTADVHRFFERESVSRTASTSSGSRAPEGSGRSTGTRDGKTGGAVALKLLHAGQCLARSHRETRILAKLRHPAVVRYVASGEHPPDGTPFFAMVIAGGLCGNFGVTSERRCPSTPGFLTFRSWKSRGAAREVRF